LKVESSVKSWAGKKVCSLVGKKAVKKAGTMEYLSAGLMVDR
jgi:hypothetical protein